jgi:hypothetical protein
MNARARAHTHIHTSYLAYQILPSASLMKTIIEIVFYSSSYMPMHQAARKSTSNSISVENRWHRNTRSAADLYSDVHLEDTAGDARRRRSHRDKPRSSRHFLYMLLHPRVNSRARTSQIASHLKFLFGKQLLCFVRVFDVRRRQRLVQHFNKGGCRGGHT